jgi:hypothetical protein
MSVIIRRKKLLVFLITLIAIIPNFAEAIEDSSWGMNTHIPTNDQLELCNELGVGWIRVSFNWADVEAAGKNQFNWGTLDNVVAQASSRNIHIYGSIGDTPPWASASGGRNAPPTNPSDWHDFVHACVSRYSYWVCHWGMWNEPNLPQFWTGTWENYVNVILIPGYQAAKAADPDCLVLGPGLSDANRVDTLEFFDSVMENAGSYIDIATQHSYAGSVSDIMFFIDNFIYPTLQNRAPGKELWLTETGWRTDTQGENFQATMYWEMCEAIEAREHIGKVFFYQLSDGPEPEQWGIIRYPDNSRKPAFAQYQSYISGSTPPELSSGCFIATAAYRTSMAWEVKTLSTFRDKFLLTNFHGKQFVKCYYKISPRIAKIISGNGLLRLMVRTGLRPIVFLCKNLPADH